MFLLPGFLFLSSFALLVTELGECCSFLDKELGGSTGSEMQGWGMQPHSESQLLREPKQHMAVYQHSEHYSSRLVAASSSTSGSGKEDTCLARPPSLAPGTVRHLEGAQLKIHDMKKVGTGTGRKVLMPVFPALKQDSKEFKSSNPAWVTM